MTKQQPIAQKVKAAIKAAGIDTKKISVTTSHPGYEEVIRVVIKDAAIDINAVEQIAHRFQEVEYDERCQEILQGGNTFVRVRYDYETERAAFEALKPMGQDIAKQCENVTKTINIDAYPGNGKKFLIVADQNYISVIDNTDPDAINRPHRTLTQSDYYPEAMGRAIANAIFWLGGRYVDNIPDPEPEPERPRKSPNYYIIAAGIDSFTRYRVEAATPDVETARKTAAECRIADMTLYGIAPIYYICTRSEVLARVDDNGYHAPKGKPQHTPKKIMITIDAWKLHNQ